MGSQYIFIYGDECSDVASLPSYPITRRKQQASSSKRYQKIEQTDNVVSTSTKREKEEKKERKTDAEGTAIKTAEDVETMHE